MSRSDETIYTRVVKDRFSSSTDEGDAEIDTSDECINNPEVQLIEQLINHSITAPKPSRE